MEVKNLIKSRRIELGLTLKDVATAVGVSEGTVSRWETGGIANMKRSRLYALSKVLQLSPLELMDMSEEEASVVSKEDTELQEIRDACKENPNLRLLFKISLGASAEDIKQAIKIIEALRNND